MMSFVALFQAKETVIWVILPFYMFGTIATVVTTVIVTGSNPTDPTVNLYRLHLKTLDGYKAGLSKTYVKFH